MRRVVSWYFEVAHDLLAAIAKPLDSGAKGFWRVAVFVVLYGAVVLLGAGFLVLWGAVLVEHAARRVWSWLGATLTIGG